MYQNGLGCQAIGVSVQIVVIGVVFTSRRSEANKFRPVANGGCGPLVVIGTGFGMGSCGGFQFGFNWSSIPLQLTLVGVRDFNWNSRRVEAGLNSVALQCSLFLPEFTIFPGSVRNQRWLSAHISA
jgi:hypothetical protein